MNATTLKTRHGLIIQGAVAEALKHANLSFKENWQYHPDYERPDFSLPNSNNPKFVIEVHQTDARDSFQMKILRLLNAVSEAKAYFGESLISVNILFGNPDVEVPASNVRALFGFFDINIVPFKDSANQGAIKNLEESALKLAGDDSLSVADATDRLVNIERAGIDALSLLLAKALKGATANPVLLPVWQSERQRAGSLNVSPTVGRTTHYKLGILQSLFLSDKHFLELMADKDPNKQSSTLKEQLVMTGLATVFPSVRGNMFVLAPILREFLNDPKAFEFRKLCEDRLDAEPSMHWFFEDIRNPARRIAMAELFKKFATAGRASLISEIAKLLANASQHGVNHERNWMADFLPIVAEVSQNEFNRQIVQSGKDINNYQYPFNHVTGRFERLLNNPAHFHYYAEASVDVYYQLCKERAKDPTASDRSPQDLARGLMSLRMDGAMKLQRFNPLYEVVESVAQSHNLTAEYVHEPSLIYDLAGRSGRLGKFDLIIVSDGKSSAVVNALYIGEGYGSDHKADEWSARRRALDYRFGDNRVVVVKRSAYVLVVDGVWTDKSIRKLSAAGWTHIIRLSELDSVIKNIFKK